MPKISASPNRVYIVKIGDRLKIVRANSAATARNHVVDGLVSVECATAGELADLVTQGVPIETAGQPSPAPASTQGQANIVAAAQPGPGVDHQPV